MFVLSKVGGWVLEPGNLLVLLLGVGVLLWGTRWDRWARRGVRGVLLLAVLLGLGPAGDVLVGTLEDRFPVPVLPARVDGVVVLGGAVDAATGQARQQPVLNGAAERVTALVTLARRYPDATLVYAGGNGSLDRELPAESTAVPALLQDLGVDPARVLLDGRSRNTFENALEAKALARPQPGQTWVLVTSALHMPRAVGAFRAVGFAVLPYPVDFQTDGSGRWGWHARVLDGLDRLSAGVHEVLGLLAYRLTGRTTELWPAP